jgi:hypothetical protein
MWLRFEVTMIVNIRTEIFWDMMPCSIHSSLIFAYFHLRTYKMNTKFPIQQSLLNSLFCLFLTLFNNIFSTTNVIYYQIVIWLWMLWKKVVVAYSEVLSQDWGNHEKPLDSRSPGQKLTFGTPKHKMGMLITWLWHSVYFSIPLACCLFHQSYPFYFRKHAE